MRRTVKGGDEPNLRHVELRRGQDLQVEMSKMQGSLGGWRWRLRDHLSKEQKPSSRPRGKQNIWRGDGQIVTYIHK